jgi:hypothetical protein
MPLLSWLLMSGGAASLVPVIVADDIGTTVANPVTTVSVVNSGVAGQLCILHVVGRASTGPVLPTFTPPSGFQSINSVVNTIDMACQAWWKILDGTEGVNLTVTSSEAATQGMALGSLIITGFGTTPVHVSRVDSSVGNDANVAFGSLVTTDANCLILRLTGATVAAAGVLSVTQPGGYAENYDGHSTNAAAIRRLASAGSKSLVAAGATGVENGTLTAARIWGAISIAITPLVITSTGGLITPNFRIKDLANMRRRRR